MFKHKNPVIFRAASPLVPDSLPGALPLDPRPPL